jgi:hypothetical protein
MPNITSLLWAIKKANLRVRVLPAINLNEEWTQRQFDERRRLGISV